MRAAEPRRPPFALAVLTMVLPVFLMLLKAIAYLTAGEGTRLRDGWLVAVGCGWPPARPRSRP